MALTPLKVLLFLFGVVAAGAGTAYVTGALDPYLPSRPAEVASLPADPAPDAAKPDAEAKPEAAVPDPAKPEAAPEDAKPEAGAATPEIVVPSFDLVRVEPDGSIVIAGKAAAGSVVEIVTGASVLGRTEVGPSGDFVVALDDRLKPGDYQIVLRSTAPDNVVATSTETAIVSVPDSEAGQVLALVEQPGAPSKLITVPDAEPAAEKVDETRPATAPEDVAATDEPAAAPADEKTAEQAAETPVEPGTPVEPKTETAMAEPEKPADEQPAAPATVEDGTPKTDMAQAGEKPAEEMPAAEEPAAETPAAGEDVAAAPEEPVAAEEAPAVAEDKTAAPEEKADEQVAMAEPEKPAVKPATPPPAARIAVEAVEIEGRNVFVAGVAEVGSMVRVYANDILLGQTIVSEGGRFLVEAVRDLPVGDYIVRADLLARDGAKVLARAAVPFEREPGEAIAAVAPKAPAQEAPQPEEKTMVEAAEDAPAAADAEPAEPAQETVVAEETVKDDQVAAEAPVSEPVVEENAKPAEPEAKDQQMAAAEAPAMPDTGKAGRVTTEAPADPAEETKEAGTMAETPATETPTTEMAADEPAAAQPEATKPEETVAMAEKPEAVDEEPASAEQPAADAPGDAAPGPTTVEDAATPSEPDEQTAMAEPETVPEVLAPKLESAEGAVIIRRGDTLWRISRRVYGRGVRYTTIYLANQNQIRDPDRIWPGQVFDVPDKTGEGEAADLTTMGDQVVR